MKNILAIATIVGALVFSTTTPSAAQARKKNIFQRPMDGTVNYSQIQENGKVGMINDKSGRQVLAPIYDEVNFFAGNIAVKRDGKVGVYSLQGRQILPLEFNQIELLDFDYYKVRQNNKVGIYTKSGKQILPVEFDQITLFNFNHYKVTRNGKMGIFTKGGKQILAPEFDNISVYNFDYYKAKKNNTEGIYSVAGKPII